MFAEYPLRFPLRLWSMVAMLLACLCLPAQGVEVADLYTAEVLVTAQDERQMQEGARAGLLQVLVRVSGNMAVEQSETIQASLGEPQRYYYQYSFESTDRTLQLGDALVPASILRLAFEPTAVAGLLRQAGFPVWGSNRPSLLAWLATSDEEGRRILSGYEESPLVDAMNTQARARGLPMMYPLMDIEDAGQLSSAEVWGGFVERIERASMRYNPDAIIAGRVIQQPDGSWEGSWSYRLDDKWNQFGNTGLSEEAMMAGVVNYLADALAVRYALDASRSSVLLQVEGVNSLERYAAATQYLDGLAPVLEASLLEVNGDILQFHLVTEGQVPQLIETIELDKQMALVDESSSRGEVLLRYRWLR